MQKGTSQDHWKMEVKCVYLIMETYKMAIILYRLAKQL
ncbi:hypothetical protein M2419_000870 [Sphingobacterium sp. BIGb0116]|nr:hypothetical protein [Sphingobacterium sp. BIGb0116]